MYLFYPDRRHKVVGSENRPITNLQNICDSSPGLSPSWGDMVRADVTCTYRGFMPQERSSKIMTFKAYTGAYLPFLSFREREGNTFELLLCGM